ncbi:MAG TPA: nicotinate-nucleotide adenylyltransferase [Rhizomicrobium sp.]|nr:nicotinate-nucleotide adenylyltransferase [Rhizomicrobium sp.]
MRPPPNWIKPPGPVAPGLKIGLLGGSFNPAHAGHVHISTVALRRLGLDYVWWLVAPQNPLKPSFGMAPLAKRLAFARAEAAVQPRIVVMDIEQNLGTRYTIDTLRRLKQRFGQVHFVWLMGSDNLAGFQRWRRWEEIARTLPIAIVTRPGSVMATLGAKPAIRFRRRFVRDHLAFARARPPALTVLDGPRNTLSSTAIRASCASSEIFVNVLPT